MAGQEPFPNCSMPFPWTPARSHSDQPLLSPISHYRELFAAGRKRRKFGNDLRDAQKQSLVQPEPVEQPELPPTAYDRPACRADATTYTYNFAQDFAMSDDIIESDATDDCSDYEPRRKSEEHESCPSPQRQASHPAKRKSREADDPEDTHEWKTDCQQEETHWQDADHTNFSPLPTLGRESSKGVFSTENSESNVTTETSPPPPESREKSLELGLMTKDWSGQREQSVELCETPRSFRASTHTVYQHAELGFETVTLEDADSGDTDQSILEPLPEACTLQRTEISQSGPEETLVKGRQIAPPPETPALGESAQSAVRINYDNCSVNTEDDDADLQYTVSDAILEMHRLMSISFWGDDEQWLARIAGPTPRSWPCTPYSDDIIRTSAKLIETINTIKTQEGHYKQARFATTLEHRTSSLVNKIREACTTICRHLFGSQQLDSHQNPQVHKETVHRMRKYAMPRLVVVLSKAFTLLCNPMPEMSDLVVFITENICFDMERIAKIIEIGTDANEGDSGAKVEEFLRALAVVREWAKAERDVEGASRCIAL